MRYQLVVLTVLLETPANRRLELEGLRLATLDQLLSVAVRSATPHRKLTISPWFTEAAP
jgi:hypothetical protein